LIFVPNFAPRLSSAPKIMVASACKFETGGAFKKGVAVMLSRVAPALFVLLWSTGFIGTKLGASGAEPFTFIAIRFVLVLALLIPLGWFTGGRRLTGTERLNAMIVGTLVHATYLSGVMWAMRAGMAANVSALIVSLQPVLTAVLAGIFLGERISRVNWFGAGLGLAGAAMVVAPKLMTTVNAGITTATLVSVVLALFAITCGTIYQKRHAGDIELLAGAIWQYSGALIVVTPLALMFETGQVEWTPGVIGALAWLVLVLSIGAMGLLMMLLRENAVSRISALFYLVPGVTALLSFLVFGEKLGAVQFAGLVVVSIAVLLMQAKRPSPIP
jgi:drug/metabolite transporter (DMT)-like permease